MDCVNFDSDAAWEKYDTNCYIIDDKKIGQIIINDATDLKSISDGIYDFLISSNNLEHIANPIKALFEFDCVFIA